MPQGLGRLGAKPVPRSHAHNKKRQAAQKAPKKGRKTIAARKPAVAELATTKAINKRNQALVAAKALSEHSRFFLSDLTKQGEREQAQQIQVRNKKQGKSKAKNRLEQQLEQLKKKK